MATNTQSGVRMTERVLQDLKIAGVVVGEVLVMVMGVVGLAYCWHLISSAPKLEGLPAQVKCLPCRGADIAVYLAPARPGGIDTCMCMPPELFSDGRAIPLPDVSEGWL